MTVLLFRANISLSTGEKIMRRPRRNHTAAFKAKVALAAIQGEHPLAVLAQQFDVHATQIAQWKSELLKGATDIFDGNSAASEPAADITALHAKIGKLTLENDFLESALTKAGLLSVKR